jgi:hypothetical protein
MYVIMVFIVREETIRVLVAKTGEEKSKPPFDLLLSPKFSHQ